jgi:hypothetical protein
MRWRTELGPWVVRPRPAGVWLAVYASVWLATAGRGMGLGDVVLAPLLGLVLGWLGWGSSLVGLAPGFLGGAMVGVALIATGRAKRRSRIPHGPFMLAGALLGVFAGQPLWTHIWSSSASADAPRTASTSHRYEDDLSQSRYSSNRPNGRPHKQRRTSHRKRRESMTTHVLPAAVAGERGSRGRRRRRAGVVIAAYTAVAVVAAAGVGYALWTASGTGSGEAKAKSAVALTVSAGTASAQLYPGASGDVVFSLTNPNPYNVSLTGWSGATVTSTSDTVGCPASNFTINAGSITPTTITGSNGTGTVTVTNGITMVSAAPNACQGVTVTVNATLTGIQA